MDQITLQLPMVVDSTCMSFTSQMLTQKQRQHFDSFGFVLLRRLFDAAEMDTLRREFEIGLESKYRHAPFDGTRMHHTYLMESNTPFFASLLEDSRIVTVAESLGGPDILGINATGNRHVGNTPWHADTDSYHQYGVKFVFYFDPLTAANGALRVVPGSHHRPYFDQMREFRRAHQNPDGSSIDEVPGFSIESEPGDVIVFDHRLSHASRGGRGDRRLGAVVYYHNPTTPEEEKALRLAFHKRKKSDLEKFDLRVGSWYDAAWWSTADASPRRLRWRQRLESLDFFSPLNET